MKPSPLVHSSGKAKALVPVPSAEVVPVQRAEGSSAGSGSKKRGQRAPRPSANNVLFALATARPGRAVVWCPHITGVTAVLHPLPHIALHIVQAEIVGHKGAHRGGVYIAVRAIECLPVLVEHLGGKIGRTLENFLEGTIGAISILAKGVVGFGHQHSDFPSRWLQDR